MIDDPRLYPDPSAANDDARALHELAQASLGAATGELAAAIDADIRSRLMHWFDGADGASLARCLADSPSAAVHRHLWRAIVAAVEARDEEGLAVSLFAVPVVVVAAADAGDESTLDGVLTDPAGIAEVLRAHDALGGCRQFAVGGTLVAADAIDVARLPALRREVRALAVGATLQQLDLPPVPMVTARGHETVHLRFLVGTAIGAGKSRITGADAVGAWGIPLATALSRQIARPGVTVHALPRPPASLPVAVAAGRSARREVAAMLFASAAIRTLRASVGEPIAIVSAHRCEQAQMGGELRVSLSSPFEPKEAQGFRCPLDAIDRVADVATMLVDLLHDCRVADVRTLAGVHPDRDPMTGLALLFKPQTIPPGSESLLH